MAKTRQALMSAVVLGVTSFGGTKAFAGDPLTLVLHVTNYAGVSAADLAGAEKEATRIYKDAGIHTVWMHGGETADGGSTDSRHLAVLLLDEVMSQKKIDAEHIGANVLGQAGHATARAYILTARVAVAAGRFRREFHTALGRVLAHEIGHMVLPAYSHSDVGIMRPVLDLTNTPQQFSREQVVAIHGTVAADLAAVPRASTN